MSIPIISDELLDRIARGDFADVTQGDLRALAAEARSYRDAAEPIGAEPFVDETHMPICGYSPPITRDRTRIIGCTCGWRTPLGTTDSDDAYAAHAAFIRTGGQP